MKRFRNEISNFMQTVLRIRDVAPMVQDRFRISQHECRMGLL